MDILKIVGDKGKDSYYEGLRHEQLVHRNYGYALS